MSDAPTASAESLMAEVLGALLECVGAIRARAGHQNANLFEAGGLYPRMADVLDGEPLRRSMR
jgi:hypothetical protein